MENPQIPNPNLDKRYVVGWEPRNDRTLVFVYDKLSHKIVYSVNTSERKKAYPYIQTYYGKDNCVPPRQINVSFYQN